MLGVAQVFLEMSDEGAEGKLRADMVCVSRCVCLGREGEHSPLPSLLLCILRRPFDPAGRARRS